jgi:hypothetical protein
MLVEKIESPLTKNIIRQENSSRVTGDLILDFDQVRFNLHIETAPRMSSIIFKHQKCPMMYS